MKFLSTVGLLLMLVALAWSRRAGCDEIHDAASSGNLAKVESLLKHNPHVVFSKDPHDETPLHMAAFYGHKEVAALLLDKGATVNARNKDGYTPLHDAAYAGHKDVAELLLARGAKVNAKADDGLTPLHDAAIGNHKDVVEFLLAKGANVDAKDNDGQKPLHLAAGAGEKDVVDLLLAKGGKVGARDVGGQTPLHCAAGPKDVADWLLTRGGKGSAKAADDQRPLHCAAGPKALVRRNGDVGSGPWYTVGMKNSASYAAEPLVLTPEQERFLETSSGRRASRYEEVRRATLILMLAKGDSYATITRQLGCNSHYISRWRRRFVEQGVAGLCSQHRGSKARTMTPKLEARILAKVQQVPDDGSTHWTTRKLSRALGVNHMMIHRVLKRANLKPHIFGRYKASNDPDFEAKALDVIGLYLTPPQHAAVFCVDEKTAIQALDRRERVLPLRPGRAERHGFEYHRHGTLSLYGALNTRTGEVIGKTAASHTSAEFVAFLHQIMASQPKKKEIHIIADNLSAHKTKLVQSFLDQHPQVRIHYTPTYSSWLNQIEIWFGQIQADVIKRGIFTSVKNLSAKLMLYIRHYNKRAVPFKWSYSDVTHRIMPDAHASVTSY